MSISVDRIGRNEVGPSNKLFITNEQHELENFKEINTSNITKRSKIDGTNSREIEINEDSNEDLPILSLDKDLEFPEGGKEAYMVLFGAFMGIIPNFGFMNSLGAIETYVSENQFKNYSSTTIAWIFSLLLFVNLLMVVFSGTFFDRNGAKKPMILGTILVGIGFMGAANATNTWQMILSFSIVVGMGNGILESPLLGCVSHYFSKKRGLMISIAGSGGSIGGIIFPIMLRKLFENVGYSWTMRIFGFIQIGCYAISIALVHERLPLQNTTEEKFWDKVSIYLMAVDFKSLTDYKYLFNVLGCAFAEAAALTISTYQISYARAQGCSLNDSYVMLSVSHATGFVGRWLSGYIADKFGRFNVLIGTLMVSGAILYVCLLPFSSNVVALYVFSALWGFFTGSIFPLLSVCCGQISRTEEFGRRYGTMYFVVSFATLVSIPIAGAIIGKEDTIGFRNWVIYSGVTILFAGLFYYVSRVFCVGNKLIKF